MEWNIKKYFIELFELADSISTQISSSKGLLNIQYIRFHLADIIIFILTFTSDLLHCDTPY